MRTFEEVRELLTAKFRREKQRLKTYGTKANSFDLAHATARFVLALMSESRAHEHKRLKKILDKQPSQGNVRKIWEWHRERLKATSDMSKVLHRYAETTEKQRPWRSKTEQRIDKEENRKKHKHGHKRSVRSSRD